MPIRYNIIDDIIPTKGGIKREQIRRHPCITSSERQIKNLANTIKTMLITSKASESKLVINKEQVDIIELTQQAQEQIDTNYASKPHAIGIYDHREENALVYADKYLIENVMHNLIVWRGAHCSEESLNNVMYNLRRYFAKDASTHLETLRGEGFKMWMDE